MRSTIYAVGLLILCHFLWSTNNIAGRWLGSSLDPVTITSLRWILASIFYPLVIGPGVLKRIGPYMGPGSLFLGMLGMVLFNMILYTALSTAPASLVGLAYGFTPIAIIATGAIFRVSRPGRLQILGSLLSTAGVVILFLSREASPSSSSDLMGMVLGILSGFVWATYTVIQSRLYPRSDQAAITYASMILAAPLLGAAASPMIYRSLGTLARPEIAEALVWISAAPGALAYYAWNKGVSIVGPAAAAPFSNLIPVFTAVMGSLLLGERLSLGDLGGGSLVVIGSTISMLDRRKG